MKPTRITVKPHNVKFLKTLALQMGISDITEVLNYLLLDIKGLNYRYGDKPIPQQQQQQAPIGFDSTTFESTFVPNHDGDYHEHNHIEIDPVIARMSQLIEEF